MQRINIGNPDFKYDSEDPDGFRSGMHRVGPTLGAVQLGTTVYEVPPGQAICPYHYEYAEEEWLLVLQGSPTLRHPEGNDVLEPWDLVCFPTGPDGAHPVRNETTEPVARPDVLDGQGARGDGVPGQRQDRGLDRQQGRRPDGRAVERRRLLHGRGRLGTADADLDDPLRSA